MEGQANESKVDNIIVVWNKEREVKSKDHAAGGRRKRNPSSLFGELVGIKS